MRRFSETMTACLLELLDSGSLASRMYPPLHRILRHRLQAALVVRDGHPISRCDHHGFNGYDLGRSDGEFFQNEENFSLVNTLDPITDNGAAARIQHLCTSLTGHIDIYGMIGSGTFADVYLACQRGNYMHPANRRHYAIKAHNHITLKGAQAEGYLEPTMVPLFDVNSMRYIPLEALLLLLLTDCDRFPKLDSVYTHDRFTAIVMSSCIDPFPDQYPLDDGDFSRVFPAFTLKYLLTSDHRPLLDEMAACKVAAQILEGIAYMAQMNLWHNDLSILNIIVDQQLNVTIIDLADCIFGLEDEDFLEDTYSYIPFQEYQMCPELVRELSRPNTIRSDWTADAYLPHDYRQKTLWKYGVLIYGILHGFWPWDTPSPHDVDLVDMDSVSGERICERRMRMLEEDVFINPSLSQDCRDVLQALLARDPARRPSLETLTRFPWFQQWKNVNRDFIRPFSWEFQRSYTTLW